MPSHPTEVDTASPGAIEPGSSHPETRHQLSVLFCDPTVEQAKETGEKLTHNSVLMGHPLDSFVQGTENQPAQTQLKQNHEWTGNWDQPSQPVRSIYPFFACWLCAMRRPEWPGGSLDFQLHCVGAVFPGGRLSPLEIKTSKQAEHKVVGPRSRNHPSGLQGIAVKRVTPTFTRLSPRSLYSG